MKDYLFLRSKLFDTPLLIAQNKLDDILSIVSSRLNIVANAETVTGHATSGLADIEVDTTLGVVGVQGTMVSRYHAAGSGMTSYDQIMDQFDNHLNDRGIDAILLDVDTFGGEAAGCFDLADHIRESRQVKPIFSLVNSNALSAGIALATAAGTVIIIPDAMLGSIGVVATHVDETERDKKAGDKITHIFAGSHKVDHSPHLPIKAETLQWLQTMVDGSYEEFITLVAKNRGLDVDQVRDQQAAIFNGVDAITAGLADFVMPARQAVDHVLNEVSIMTTNTNDKGASAAVADAPKQVADAPAPVVEATVEPVAAPTNVISLADHQKETEQAAADAAEITTLCVNGKYPELAAGLIKQRLTVSQAKAALFDHMVEADPVIINSSPDQTGAGSEAATEGRNLLVGAMQALNKGAR